MTLLHLVQVNGSTSIRTLSTSQLAGSSSICFEVEDSVHSTDDGEGKEVCCRGGAGQL